MDDEGDRLEIRTTDADDLDPGRAAVRRGHDLPPDLGRSAGHPRHGRQAPGQRVIVGDQPVGLTVFVELRRIIDRDMSVRAKDPIREFLAEADHDRLDDDQGGNAQHHADQRVPGDHRDAAFAATRSQVAPGDQPLEGGEGCGTGGQEGSPGKVGRTL